MILIKLLLLYGRVRFYFINVLIYFIITLWYVAKNSTIFVCKFLLSRNSCNFSIIWHFILNLFVFWPIMPPNQITKSKNIGTIFFSIKEHQDDFLKIKIPVFKVMPINAFLKICIYNLINTTYFIFTFVGMR